MSLALGMGPTKALAMAINAVEIVIRSNCILHLRPTQQTLNSTVQRLVGTAETRDRTLERVAALAYDHSMIRLNRLYITG